MEKLPTDLWVMILEEVAKHESYNPRVLSYVPPLQKLREVSKWFNFGLTPILYRDRYLRSSCLRKVDDPFSIQELANIQAHSKVLVMADYDDMEDALLEPAAQFISSCMLLTGLKWYTDRSVYHRDKIDPQPNGTVPVIVLNALVRKLGKRVRIDIDGGSFEGYGALDPRSLGFIEQSPTDHSGTATNLSEDILDVLDIQSHWSVPTLTSSGTRLPPMKHLILREYQWNHSLQDSDALWDFSQLQYLRLDLVPIIPFLQSIPQSALRNLRSLQITNNDFPQVRKAIRHGLLDKLFKSTKQLEELTIQNDWSSIICVKSLERLRNLRVLRLSDSSIVQGFTGSESVQFLDDTDLRLIRCSCPLLVGLEVGMNPEHFENNDISPFLAELACFQTLQRLRIHNNETNSEVTTPTPPSPPLLASGTMAPSLDGVPLPPPPHFITLFETDIEAENDFDASSPHPTTATNSILTANISESQTPGAGSGAEEEPDFKILRTNHIFSLLRAAKVGLPFLRIEISMPGGSGFYEYVHEDEEKMREKLKWRGDVGASD